MDEIDLGLLFYMAEDMVINLEPFKTMAQHFAIEESEVLERLKILQKKGQLKRISPILYHHKTTYKYNALTVWEATYDQISDLANILMSYKHISHVYERDISKDWKYNVYGMIHGKSKEDIDQIVSEIVKEVGEIPHKLIYTKKEWKKTSPDLKALLG